MAEIPRTSIVTLTINPAIDVSTSVTKMVPVTKMRCAQAHRDPGGGGINVARVLKRLGIEATAIYPAGGATGHPGPSKRIFHRFFCLIQTDV